MRGKIKLLPKTEGKGQEERLGQQWRHFGISLLTFPFRGPAEWKKPNRNGKKATARPGLQPSLSDTTSLSLPLTHCSRKAPKQDKWRRSKHIWCEELRKAGKCGKRRSRLGRPRKITRSGETGETMVALTLKGNPLENENH